MMTVVEESDKSPVTGGCQIGPKMNGPGQFDTTTSLLAQAQLVDMYSCEVRFSYYSLFIMPPPFIMGGGGGHIASPLSVRPYIHTYVPYVRKMVSGPYLL